MTKVTAPSSWAQFERSVRDRVPALLGCLPAFPDAILVAGCQRSGTTAVCRLLKEALAMPDFRLTKDDELDAALLLSGVATADWQGRACLQTTYLNDRYVEYFAHEDYRLIWLLRNPQSVVQSMLRNWRRGALRRLFSRCGSQELGPAERRRYERFGTLGFSRLTMACHSYNAKTAQTARLVERLPAERLYILDYDDLVDDPAAELPPLFEFCDVSYDAQYAAGLKRSRKGTRDLLSASDHAAIETACRSGYEAARKIAAGYGSDRDRSRQDR
jgi:hypothetical protein